MNNFESHNKNNDNFNNSIYQNSTPTFYTESYKKKKAGRVNGIFQLIIVALISSILGGGVVFAAFQFVAPVVQPQASSYFNSLI